MASQGSPPYTWGAPGISLDVRADHGITPIYMGSTNQTSNRDDGNQDHPHIHGEHADGVFTDKTTQGSPPYTWGARVDRVNSVLIGGITPIYMGSTTLEFAL